MVDLEEKVNQLEKWTDGKGLIVQGAAGTFCSGSDLNAVRAISNPEVQQQSLTFPIASFDSWDFNTWWSLNDVCFSF